MRLGLAPLLISLASAAAIRTAGAAEVLSEYQVKAAFLLHFVKFVEWPTASSPSTPITICVLGKDPFEGELDQIVRRKTVDGRPLEIRKMTGLASLSACAVVFVSPSETRRFDAIRAALASGNTLTVGDSEGFAQRGGMINFVMENHRVRFQVNVAAAEKAHLKISSRLLQLAILVKGGEK